MVFLIKLNPLAALFFRRD